MLNYELAFVSNFFTTSSLFICLFVYLFTLYLPLTKKTNNNLQNKHIKYNHI